MDQPKKGMHRAAAPCAVSAEALVYRCAEAYDPLRLAPRRVTEWGHQAVLDAWQKCGSFRSSTQFACKNSISHI